LDVEQDVAKDEGNLGGETITFLASFPAIQSAIKIDGAGGARIQLDIPESEMGNFIKATMWRGERLTVTLELFKRDLTGLDDGEKQADEKPKRRTSKVGRGRA